jgi:hypothetical protein
MVTEFSESMRVIDAQLRETPGGPQLNIASPIGFYISPEELNAAVKTISTQPGFSQYLALFGVEDETNNYTVCLVGADAKGNVLDVYKQNDSAPVEEKWPRKTALTLSSSTDELSKFLS